MANVTENSIFTKEKTISFEVFPPKKDDDFASAFSVLDELGKLSPDYISVTYGAGGSRAGKTVEIADYIENKLGIPSIAHVTCVGGTKESVSAVIDSLKQVGVNHILALRGDRPADMTDEAFNAREFEHASDLISFLKQDPSLHIAGACYPEKHFDAFSFETDLRYLKAKQDLGAEYFISQLFFDNDYFYDFTDRAEKKGIKVPISAGIMPITTPKQIGTIVTLSGSSIPKHFADIIAKYGESPEEMRKAGIDYAIRQINDLLSNGVSHIHIYSMNKPKVTAEIMAGLKA
ncbi:MAG: methylenetetrahydrofolate reductase [NAD(P)H] [Lachnospiraceae bacterium]|nr:methylenetetrahydrofolate reductase [NAD(P)H] [Lachnospiraceae bacterium]